VASCASTVFAINLAKYYVKKANIIEQCRKKRGNWFEEQE
jgi:hypothetical protein